MAGLGFFVAALSWLLQLSAGTPTVWTPRLLSVDYNETNETETTTSAPNMAYHKVIGSILLDVGADPQAFVDNPNSTKAIAKGLAKQLDDVTEDMLEVTLDVQDASRRLAAVRELQDRSSKLVFVTYIITMAGTDAASLAAQGDRIVSAVGAITPAAMKQSLEDEFTSAGISVTLTEVVVGEAFSHEVDAEDQAVILPLSTEPPTSSPNPSPDPSTSTTPSSSPSTTTSRSTGSGEDTDAEDGSVMKSQAGIFTIVLVLLTMVHV